MIRQAISFIICAYNEENYIADCIAAINCEMRNYSVPFEIIVVDNGSTDKTWLKAAADNVRIIFEPKRGISNARLTGFKEAKHEFCAMLDADGRLTQGWFLKAMLPFHDSSVVAVSGPLRFYDGPKYLNVAAKQFYQIARILHHLWPTVQGGNYVARRDALAGAFNPDIEFWGEDTYTATKLAEKGKIVLNPCMVVETSARRMRSGGVLRTTGAYIVEYLAGNILHKPIGKKYANYR